MDNKVLYCTVDWVSSEEISLGGKSYYNCKVIAAGEKFATYFLAEYGEKPKRGEYVATSDYYLTNSRTYRSPNTKEKPAKMLAALRVDAWQIVDEPESMQEVRVNAKGAVIKSKNVQLKTVGKREIPFLPVTFLTKNEDGVEFGLLACCFGDIAKEVSRVKSVEKAQICARLRRNRKDDTYELNVVNLELLNKTKYSK